MFKNFIFLLLTLFSPSKIQTTNCRPPFGCFPTSDFYDIRRPYNPDPQYPQDLGIKFYLYAQWFQSNKEKENWAQEIYDRESQRSRFDQLFVPFVINTEDLLSPSLLVSKLNNFKSYRLFDLFPIFKLDESKKWTAMVIHGFRTNSTKSKWMKRIKNLLLENRMDRQYEMVIIVDWGPGSKGSYPQACSNARLAGAEAAYLLRMLIQTFPHITTDRIHLIGHSLGAHIAGYIGKNFTGKLGRITGLDPAGPFFENMPSTVRLDQSDGLFVDIIHSNARSPPHFSLGISQLLGHVDFFPNGGHHQPGCHPLTSKNLNLSVLIEKKLFGMISCDHYRAAKLFLYSIPRNESKTWCRFRASHCDNWKTYVYDICPGKFLCRQYDQNKLIQDNYCAQMGFFAYRWTQNKKYTNDDKNSVTFYLRTLDQDPFCGE